MTAARERTSRPTSRATSRPTGRPPLTEERKAEIRLEIARAAVDLFVTQGVAATTGEQIGAAVGVSSRTVWRYFPSKESCVRPLFSAGIDLIVDCLRQWGPEQPLEELLDRALARRGRPARRTRPGDRRRSGTADPHRARPASHLAPDVRRGRTGVRPRPRRPGRTPRRRPASDDPGGDVQRGPARCGRALRLAHRRRPPGPDDGPDRTDGDVALGVGGCCGGGRVAGPYGGRVRIRGERWGRASRGHHQSGPREGQTGLRVWQSGPGTRRPVTGDAPAGPRGAAAALCLRDDRKP